MTTPIRTLRENTPDRWQRALRRALANGVTVRQLAGSGAWVATSATDSEIAYIVSIDSCECPAEQFGDPVCSHRAALAHRLGILSLDPEPGPDSPAPAAEIAITVRIECAACAGSGYDAVPDPQGGWREIVCPVCRGRGSGRIPADLTAMDEHHLGIVRGEPCRECRGDGYRRMFLGGHLSDWEAVGCRTCHGAGLVPICAKPMAERSAA